MLYTTKTIAIASSEPFDAFNFNGPLVMNDPVDVGSLKNKLPFMDRYFTEIANTTTQLEESFKNYGNFVQQTIKCDDITCIFVSVMRYRHGNVFICLQHATGTNKWRVVAVCTDRIQHLGGGYGTNPISLWNNHVKNNFLHSIKIERNNGINDPSDIGYLRLAIKKYPH